MTVPKNASPPPEIAAPLPAEGFVRLHQIIAPHGPIPVHRSTWLAGVRTGRFPKPVKFFGPGISAWKVEDIRRLIAEASGQITGAA